MVYAGRLVQHQKRIFDLLKIARALLDRGVKFKLTIIGAGTEQHRMLDESEDLIAKDVLEFVGALPNAHVLEAFEQSDVFVLTSRFEGLPLSLLEAMGRGCVPVVADVRSGIPELVRDDINGYRVPIGDIQGFGERLTSLQQDAQMRLSMARKAHTTVLEGGYETSVMVSRYVPLFRRVLKEAEQGHFRRAKTRIPPFDLRSMTKIPWAYYLPESVHLVRRFRKT
jgi:glycosyltransferase involved in cell wall biosynthesis